MKRSKVVIMFTYLLVLFNLLISLPFVATGEELKVLFATPCDVSHSKEESKASLEGDSRLKENKVTLDKEVKNKEFDENLNRRGQG